MKSSEKLAIAFDIGTTTIAASLIDIETGVRLASAGSLNPQREFGADVVLRLHAACESEEKHRTMSRLVNEEAQRLAGQLLSSANAEFNNLSGIAMAGNPTMEHLLLGLPVASLAFPPHRPLFCTGRILRASALGWETDANVYLFPLPGGFVGGDLVAFLYGLFSKGVLQSNERTRQLPSPKQHELRRPDASPLQIPSEASLFLDLGTNAEIALVANGRIYATSAAAGPAFEGGNLACGMAALPGAISRVGIWGDKVTFSSLGRETPSGICGSGVIDAVAGLLEAGVLDSTGRLLSPGEIPTNLGNRVKEIGGESVFVVYQDAERLVYLSQKDIREVQLAKSAIRAGMEILFTRAGISVGEVERVVLTGSFGAELSAGALKSIGILTEKMVHLTDFVREGVLAGIEKAFCCPQGFEDVDRFAELIRVIPLSGTPAFEKLFIEHMNFPK
ncbi:MAG TPA: ASKHA domain-containing protein [Geobacteraceae bacterium]|nr:ASKHA domain-containing protein [Geobacteraceae bacterium]